MKQLLHKSLSLLLVLAMIAAFVLVPAPAQTQAAEQVTYASSNAATDIQNGVTLHAWNWSFNNIIANMATIAAQGYTAIQVPPIQQTKQATAGYSMSDWWVYYQPAAFCIDNTGNSALGNKAQFTAMCNEAHKYGIYVIVDVVANHMANSSDHNIHSNVIADLKNDSSCWHNSGKYIENYYNRYDITHYNLDGVPDLNTSNKKVQNYVLNYLKECVDAGADGFRFDAVKHIETPDDGSFGSDFWPTVINGIKAYDSDVYCYGEVLYHPDEGGSLPDTAYSKYFAITDNSWCNTVRNNVVCGQNAGAFSYSYHKNVTADKLVLWAESHDNYAGDNKFGGPSIQQINKTWALVAARANAMSLYLARAKNSYPQKLGEVTPGGWDSVEVAAVNKFHNAFVGQGEYVSNSGSIAYVERGNSGVVLVNCSGTSGSVNVPVYAMANGTYKDQITGNTFTVSNGKISGNIGSTGIAVVYNAVQCDHAEHDQQGICSNCRAQVGHSYDANNTCACGKVKPADRVIYFKNTANWSKVNIYAWNTSGEITSAWPGTAMTKVTDNVYSYTLSGEAENVIFNNGTTQTDDLVLPDTATRNNCYDFSTGTWGVYNDGPQCEHTSHTTAGLCTDCGAAVAHSYNSGVVTTAATCSAAGVKTYTCSVCSGTKTESIAKLDHKYNSGVVTTVATCTTAGVKTYTCSGCSTTKTESIAKLDHKYVNGVCSGCGAVEETSNTMKIYFQNNWLWSDVKIHFWGSSDTSDTTWPGTAMTKYGNDGTYDIYVYEVPADVAGIVINGIKDDGSGALDQTPDITSGLYDGVCFYMKWNDGNAVGSEDIGVILPCDHSGNTNKDDKDCSTALTCSVCGEVLEAAKSHSFTAATCTTPKTCSVCGKTEGGVADHSYDAGKITTDPTCTVDGVKTYTCGTCGKTKTETIAAPGHDYKAVVTAPTCTKGGYTTYQCACGDEYTADEVAALGHSYVDGICGTCGAADPDYVKPVVIPTLSLSYPTLNFKDVVYYNVYYQVSDMTDVVEMGLITFDGALSTGTIDDAAEVITGYVASGSNYMVHTNGINAKNLGDALYFKVYAKLSDGSYVYSSLAGYHAVAYAKDILANSTNAKMKSLVVAMLNYGAAAQVQFEYKTDSLMNSFLSDEQKALVADYSADMVAPVTKVDSSKIGTFGYVAGGYSALYPSVSFEGAFSVKFYFTPAKTMDGDLTMYYWSVDDYASANVLTAENATGVFTMDPVSGTYVATVEGIAARQIDETIYVAGIYESNGVSYPTGVIAYSLGTYCLDRVTNGTGNMPAFAQATVVYGFYAKDYFA